MGEYFKVKLIDGIEFTFYKKCNRVKCSDSGMVMFIHVGDDGDESILAMIPLDRIDCILNSGIEHLF